MKRPIACFLALHFFVSLIYALNVVPKLHVYPNALRSSIGQRQLKLIVRDDKLPQVQCLEKVSQEKSVLVDFSTFILQSVDVLHQQFVLVSTAPLKMNLSVQPPPSFRLWYAFLDWFP